MKLLFYRVANKKTNRRRGADAAVERILFFLFIIAFTVMVIAQTAMVNPSVRTFLTSDSQIEGLPLGEEEFLYNEGALMLELIGSDYNSDLKVLINGDQVASFNTKRMNIAVKEGDVVEIDGSDIYREQNVMIIWKSDNIENQCIGNNINVNSDVTKLIKVKMK